VSYIPETSVLEEAADPLVPYSDEDLTRIKTFLHKFQVTRPARQAERDDEDNMEDEDDDMEADEVEGTLKYEDQLVSSSAQRDLLAKDASDLALHPLQQRVANREQERLVIDLEDLNQVRYNPRSS
jgi:DNA replication licensing factor MCM7